MALPYLASRKNPLVLKLASMAETPSGNGFLVEGLHFVHDIAPENVRVALFSEKEGANELALRLEEKGCEVYIASSSVLEKLSGTVSVQDAIALVKKPALPRPDRLILLDRLQDPGNMGTVIRAAAAFGFGVLLGSGCANPYKPKVVRSSAGAILNVYTEEVPDLASSVRQLRSEGFSVLSSELDETASPPGAFPKEGKIALVLGNESQGVSEAVSAASTAKVFIPIRRDSAESLNAGVAGSILMYEFSRPED